MAWWELIPGVGDVLGKIVGIIDKAVPDKDLAAKLEQELKTQAEANAFNLDIERSHIIQTEAQGESWIQRSWRPILMLAITAILVNNYIVFPYLHSLTDKVVMLVLPGELYNLLTIGVGGYIVGRTGEKMIGTWTGAGAPLPGRPASAGGPAASKVVVAPQDPVSSDGL